MRPNNSDPNCLSLSLPKNGLLLKKYIANNADSYQMQLFFQDNISFRKLTFDECLQPLGKSVSHLDACCLAFRQSTLQKVEVLFISYKFVKGFLAITVLLLVFFELKLS